jgi:hypothetical protein
MRGRELGNYFKNTIWKTVKNMAIPEVRGGGSSRMQIIRAEVKGIDNFYPGRQALEPSLDDLLLLRLHSCRFTKLFVVRPSSLLTFLRAIFKNLTTRTSHQFGIDFPL